MAGRKIVLIGDEDAVFGLGLLGLSGRAVTTIEQARRAIAEAMADPETELILLTEDWAEAQPEFVPEAGPLVVEIPSEASAARAPGVERRIERALGIHLEG
jgi:vacuolar-type H+-ATPase subunit F/Vma7